MRTIERTRQPIDLAAYKLRSAQETDYDELVCEPFILTQNGEVKLVYLELGEEPDEAAALEEIAEACRRVEYDSSARTSGLIYTSKTFGYRPRNKVRRDYCGSTAMARDQPDEHHIVAELGSRIVERHYREHNPQLYDEHLVAAAKVIDEYRIEKDRAFTSGIINKNNPLKFHFDAGNFAGVWSGMLAFKRDIAGGHLALPEYGIGVEVRDRSLLLFDGQGALHGVTPIQKLAENAERYTIVYYSLKGLWNCAPLGEEIARIRRVRTEYEQRRATEGK